MANEHEGRSAGDSSADNNRARSGTAPGKRTLSATEGRRAARRNPRWQRKLHFDPAQYSSAAVDSPAFAHDVAAKQEGAGLPVDGVAGPRTHAALFGGKADPFGMLDEGGGGGVYRADGSIDPAPVTPAAKSPDGGNGRGAGGGGGAPRSTSAQTLRCEITDRQSTELGVQLVIGAGSTDGVDESWHVRVIGRSQVRWKITEVRRNSTVVVSRGGNDDDFADLRDVEIQGIPRATDAEADGDDDIGLTLEA